ncbi:maltose operon protein MalM [Sodalis ligni]|uniref:Maltose operon protein n=1 Tax=Sodalis ligni TaxID=2697027 RepID=A0A4R1NG62_9GAMM|nr:maltose operon protein MalM [Sodalis ligni]TCL05949.1 maltose operon protein [Sodalis ligni]
MKKHLLALCLFPALSLSSLPSFSAEPFSGPQDVSVAPAVSVAKLQSLPWQPLMPPTAREFVLDASAPGINQGDMTGPAVALTLPANQGSLEITLASVIKHESVYAPNVLVLDEQMHPAAFFPSSYFPYQKPGIASSNRLEGTLKLTPVLGQKQIFLLIYTTRQDLTGRTKMINPAKLYAEGVGNAIPDVPDPYARHSANGTVEVKVRSEQNSGNIMIGQIFSSRESQPVVVGSTAPAVNTPATPAPAAAAAAPVVPAAPAAPMLNDTESYFNRAIKQAVHDGNIDKALKLLNEAERLGSTSARQTFISSVKGKG